MKKIVSIIALFSILLVSLFLLTGCGENNSSSTGEKTPIISNEEKLIATKTEVEEGITMKSKIEATFKDGIAVSAIASVEFEDEQTASLMYQIMSATQTDLQLNGKIITMKETKPSDDAEDISKQDFIDEFTAEGYTIQN